MTSYDPFRAGSAESADKKDEKPSEPEEPAVPNGSSTEILDWVGEDKERAKLALDKENADKQRSTLVKALEKILD